MWSPSHEVGRVENGPQSHAFYMRGVPFGASMRIMALVAFCGNLGEKCEHWP
jgi:hypothetical protein